MLTYSLIIYGLLICATAQEITSSASDQNNESASHPFDYNTLVIIAVISGSLCICLCAALLCMVICYKNQQKRSNPFNKNKENPERMNTTMHQIGRRMVDLPLPCSIENHNTSSSVIIKKHIGNDRTILQLVESTSNTAISTSGSQCPSLTVPGNPFCLKHCKIL